MSSPQVSNPTPVQDSNRNCQYNAQELAVINPFKEEYFSADTPVQRKTIAQTLIYPALFNYWESIGKGVRGDDNMTREIQNLRDFIQRNWRLTGGPKAGKKAVVKPIELLWATRENDVLAEIAVMMGLPAVTTATPGWFPYRLPACKSILDKMTEDQRAELDSEAEKVREHGWPKERQTKLAPKMWYKRFDKRAKSDWLELGLLSVSLVAFERPDGQTVIDIHDQMADLMDVPAQPFENINQDKVKEIKRLFWEYIRSLKDTRNPTRATAVEPNKKDRGLQLDEDRFPVIPSPWVSENRKKKELELLYSSFLGQHYKLAKRGKGRAVPYRELERDLKSFIDPACVPIGFKMSKPRQVSLAELNRFFAHIEARQQTLGPANAFYFRSVKVGRKGNERKAAHYQSSSGSSPSSSSPSETDTEQLQSADGSADEGVADVIADEVADVVHASTKQTKKPNKGKQRLRSGAAGGIADVIADEVADVVHASTEQTKKPNKGKQRLRSGAAEGIADVIADGDVERIAGGSADSLAGIDYVLVGEPVMNRLEGLGYPRPPPHTGPADGPPTYAVRNLLLLSQSMSHQVGAMANIDPRLMDSTPNADEMANIDPRLMDSTPNADEMQPSSSTHRPRRKNADLTALAEAKKFRVKGKLRRRH